MAKSKTKPPVPKKPAPAKAAKPARTPQTHYRTPAAVLEGFGRIMRRERERMELSSNALSKLLGISQSSWSRIESGEREPSLGMLLKIHKVIPVVGHVAHFLHYGVFESE